MKFLYSKFTKAFAEVLLTVFLVIILLGISVFARLYTDDIIDGEYEFRNTWQAGSVAAAYNFKLQKEISELLREKYINSNEKIHDEDELGVNESFANSILYGIQEETQVEYEIRGNGGVSLEDFKDEELIKTILDRAQNENINYHFVVRTKDEVLFTDINDMSTVEFVSVYESWQTDKDTIYIEDYINKKIEKGDNFYKYYFFYEKFVKYFWDIVIVLIISVLITIILGIYIVVTAGYKEDGTLGIDWMDSIPYELYVLIILIMAYLDEIIFFTPSYIEVVFVGAIICLWIWLAISLIKTSISRLKNRVFLKKSIIGFVLLFFIKLLKKVFVDVDKTWKAAACIGLIMFWEAVLLLIIGTSGEEFVLIWILAKMVQFALLLNIYSMALKLRNAAKAMHDGDTEVSIDTRDMYGIIRESADYMNDIFAGLDKAVAEKLKSEQLKTELITNVSHDIKTPLTSIINYIDLMKKEEIDNPTVLEYIGIVDKQSLRLKKLTEDVIEASKAATGNIMAELTNINVSEMIAQALGEYESKFSEINLIVVYENGETPHYASADGKLLWRIIDNLFSNVCKYTLEGTRLYVKINEDGEKVVVTMKNISKFQLNISSEELKQRFVRGDSSRSTNGNGLGLSIAESLTKLQGGNLELEINGDLFIARISLVKNDKGSDGVENGENVNTEMFSEQSKE